MLRNKPLVLLGLSAMLVLTACNSSDEDKPKQNTAPKPVSETLMISADTSFMARVFAFDAEGDTLTFAVDMAPTQGSLTLSANGAYTYTPNAEYVGADRFSFAVSDGKLTAIGTVDLQVNPLPVSLRSSVRDAFAQAAQSTPLTVNARLFNQDVLDTAEFDDLVLNGEVANNE